MAGPATALMRDTSTHVNVRDDARAFSRLAVDSKDEGEAKKPSPGGKEVTREMVVSCVARAGSKRALNEKVDAYLARLTHVPLDGRGIANGLEVIASVCPGVRVLYLHDNRIARMASLGRLSHLTHLYLQNNRLTAIEGVEGCGNLEKLYLDGNCLRTVSGLEGCANLRALHVSNQKPRCASEDADVPWETNREARGLTFDPKFLVAASRSLESLDVGSCFLTESDAKALGALTELVSLDVSNCGLEDISALRPVFANCPRLRSVDVRKNPFAAAGRRHRDEAVVAARGLVSVDGVAVTPGERAFLTELDRRRRRGASTRREPLGDGGVGREHASQQRRRLDLVAQHHAQHLETIANLGEGTVDHGFDHPETFAEASGTRDAKTPGSPGSPGEFFFPGDFIPGSSPGRETPLASPTITRGSVWRRDAAPSPAAAARRANGSPGSDAAAAAAAADPPNSRFPRRSVDLGTTRNGFQGTMDGTGAFHDRDTATVALTGGVSPRTNSISSPRGGRDGGVAGGGGGRHPPRARLSSPRRSGSFEDAFAGSLEGVGGTAYATPRRGASGADTTSRFEAPDE